MVSGRFDAPSLPRARPLTRVQVRPPPRQRNDGARGHSRPASDVTLDRITAMTTPTVRRALLAFALLAPSTTLAQTAAPAAAAVRPGNMMFSVNPLGLVYGGITGEAERKLDARRTVALAANYWGAWGASYLSMDAKLRVYQRNGGKVAITNDVPTDFEGFSYGPMVGFQRISYGLCDAYAGEQCAVTGLTVGGGVDYGWRMGERKQVSLVAGAGFKTGFGYAGVGGASTSYPFVRLAVGYVPGRTGR